MPGAALPALGALAGLLLTLVALGDLPLLGSAVGAVLSGVVAGLLATHARAAAEGGLAAGAGVVLLLMGLAAAGGLGPLPAPRAAEAVLVVQALLLGFVPGAVGAAVARVAARPGPLPEALAPEPPGPGP